MCVRAQSTSANLATVRSSCARAVWVRAVCVQHKQQQQQVSCTVSSGLLHSPLAARTVNADLHSSSSSSCLLIWLLFLKGELWLRLNNRIHIHLLHTQFNYCSLLLVKTTSTNKSLSMTQAAAAAASVITQTAQCDNRTARRLQHQLRPRKLLLS